jgi:MoaA/NifB/PqqE/SkfB family radical SAM enzyme
MKKKLTARTVGFKPGERNVFFHILTTCNLSCRHCYVNQDQHGTSSVSRRELEKWLQLFISKDKETNIIFLGGEPTLHPDLPYGICLARALGYRSITVDTNGFLFHDFLEKVSPADLDYLSFSLDGPTPAVNDPIRGAGVFDICSGKLQLAVKRGFNVSVICTVSRYNIDSLNEMPPLLAGWGVKRFFIQVIGIRGKTARHCEEDWQLSPQDWLDKVPAAAQAAAELGIHVIYPKVFLTDKEVFECGGRVAENYFIFPNGRVYQCPLGEDYAVNTFRIQENQLIRNSGLTEERFFALDIPEGCVMHKLLQSDNLEYSDEGRPLYRISCCLLKQEIRHT